VSHGIQHLCFEEMEDIHWSKLNKTSYDRDALETFRIRDGNSLNIDICVPWNNPKPCGVGLQGDAFVHAPHRLDNCIFWPLEMYSFSIISLGKFICSPMTIG